MSAWVERNPFIVALGLLTCLLSIFLVFFLASSQSASAPTQAPYPTLLPASEHDGRLLVLDKEAIEAAYREHVQRMYSGWMKDETGQPTRALTGVRQAQRAYIESMSAIKKREEQLQLRSR